MTSFRTGCFRLSSPTILSIFLSCIASASYAGPLATTPLALFDGLGPDAGRWRGTAIVTGGPVLGQEVSAVVDWAAFAPGKFGQYLTSQSIAQPDPSAANEVTYAYQIVEVLTAVPGISTLSVRIDSTDATGTVSAPAFVPTGGGSEKSPNGGGDGTTQMQWFFEGGSLIGAGDTSSILVFTSEFAPQLDRLQVSSGLAGPNPSPLVASISDRVFEQEIPEPASAALLVFASIGTLLTRRRTS